jgi:hypothetical protein
MTATSPSAKAASNMPPPMRRARLSSKTVGRARTEVSGFLEPSGRVVPDDHEGPARVLPSLKPALICDTVWGITLIDRLYI